MANNIDKQSLYIFHREQVIPIPLDQAWAFFSDPRNLERITPPSLDFRIISTVPDAIGEGLQIEYRVKPLLGIPVTWISLIRDVHPPYEFTDIQIRGPYTTWEHTHRFKAVAEGVLMEDVIRYDFLLSSILPFLNTWVIRNQLERIFDYRSETLKKLF